MNRPDSNFITLCVLQADRLALCEYQITGQLLEAHVGSVVMWAVPPGTGTKAFDEHVLQV
jgi:hypothetical protein